MLTFFVTQIVSNLVCHPFVAQLALLRHVYLDLLFFCRVGWTAAIADDEVSDRNHRYGRKIIQFTSVLRLLVLNTVVAIPG